MNIKANIKCHNKPDRPMRLSIVTFIIAFVLFNTGCNGNGTLRVYDQKCENLKNPLGIDVTTPRFSWKIRSNKNGTEQKAYQVMVASNPDLLKKNQGRLNHKLEIHYQKPLL